MDVCRDMTRAQRRGISDSASGSKFAKEIAERRCDVSELEPTAIEIEVAELIGEWGPEQRERLMELKRREVESDLISLSNEDPRERRRRMALEVADQIGLNQADRKVVEAELAKEGI